MFDWLRKTGCSIGGKCSGCEWIKKGRHEQLKEKINTFRTLWTQENLPALPSEIPILDTGDKELRNVVDISFVQQGTQSIFGFYDINREKLLPAAPCPALHPDLQQFLIDLSDNPPPIDQASFRLRINQHGQRGMWIDASNINIRTLLNQKRWLRSWLREVHIEMGQRRKYVQDEGVEIRLNKAILRPWFSTPMKTLDKDIPLWTVVGAFTQPSIKANRHLVHHVMRLAEQIQAKTWLEFGSGCGNFTLPLTQYAEKIIATEISPLSREGLRKAAKQQQLHSTIEISQINLQRNTDEARTLIEKADALLVDPPRSGLHHSLNTLEAASTLPTHILYISCHARSLVKDAGRLIEFGYELIHIEAIDQFPNTPHCEWISYWRR